MRTGDGLGVKGQNGVRGVLEIATVTTVQQSVKNYLPFGFLNTFFVQIMGT